MDGMARGEPVRGPAQARHGSGNSRNGVTAKRLGTEVGDIDLATPRYRNGSFEPRPVPKGSRRLGVLSEKPACGRGHNEDRQRWSVR
jgi:transposase-like protein